MATGTVKKTYNAAEVDSKVDVVEDEFRYFGSHIARNVGVAINTSEIVVCFPWRNPKGLTPNNVTITSAAITGIGTTTATVDTARTNADALCFSLTRSGTTFTNHYAYVCAVSFTINDNT